MDVQRIPFTEVPQFSKRDIAYATQAEELTPFYTYRPSLDAFRQVMQDKANDDIDRQLLVDTLRQQYTRLGVLPDVAEHLDRLTDTQTYTVVTAHQPSLFTGPLYFVIKILSTIHLARRLNEHYPDQHVVPVFITGGEDHDFEEINHLHLFGQKIEWQNAESGAVGAMSTTTLEGAFAQLQDILGDSDNAQAIYRRVQDHYTRHPTYGAATLSFVHDLFGKYGLVVLDMNQPALKRRFLPIMREELLEQPSQNLVEQAQAQLTEIGYSGQAHAREINLFYLREGLRARIVEDKGGYRVVDTDYRFTSDEIVAELEAHPERFSPNVIMRPLYQEFVLPNLAYIGGGGELAYWLERKAQFAHFGINFPMLIRRNSLLWIDRTAAKRMDKLGLSVSDLFQNTHQLVKKLIAETTENELSLAEEMAQLQQIFTSIAAKAEQIDPTLKKAVLADHARQEKAVQNLEGRLHRAEKQKHETAINQLESVKDKLFPGGSLQERHDNFLNFYLRYGDDFFETLLPLLDPLEPGLVVVIDR